MDIKPGDRVLTTPLTWIATAAAGVTLGAEVDFVDIDPVTYNLDPAQLEAKITPNTKAILPVHLYGQCCDMDPILAIARRHGVAVVEDACHAVGAEYKGRKAGSIGHHRLLQLPRAEEHLDARRRRHGRHQRSRRL